MAEASRSIPQATDQAQRMAIATLARRAARKVVERELKAQGRRLCDVEHREIVATNPELRTLVERQARQLARNRS
jgi:hypothetical protein